MSKIHNYSKNVFEHELNHNPLFEKTNIGIKKTWRLTKEGEFYYTNKIENFEGVTNIAMYQKIFDTYEYINAKTEEKFNEFITFFNKKSLLEGLKINEIIENFNKQTLNK